ncbi:MAG: oligosaccharide repeat unit polymerase [Sulfuritalea sp.]|nr:oligosaccharide repeat unit polymerase [Sulfuritalea sp.]
MSHMLLISLLSFACLATHLAIQRNPGHPGVVHGAIWLLTSLGYVAFEAALDVVSAKTIVALIIGVLAFSIGTHLGGGFKGSAYARPELGRRFPYLPFVIVLVSALGFAMMWVKALEYVPFNPETPWRVWYASLRSAAINQGKGSFGPAGYVLNFCFAGAVYLILYSRRERHTPWLWLCIAIALGFSLLSTGRTYILLFGCLIVGAAMPQRWRARVAILLLAPLLIVWVTWLSGRLELPSSSTFRSFFELQEKVDSIASVGGAGGDLANFNLPSSHTFRSSPGLQAKMYSIAPLGAFDYLVNSNLPLTLGNMTFRTPLAVLRALGVPAEVPNLIQPYALSRVPVNVYTVFSPYYRDFGLIGVGFFMLLLGSLHGWVFRQIKTGSPMIVVGNALLFYALLMQFFQDQYFSLMSQWIQILGWTYIFNKLQPLPGGVGRSRL